MDSPYKRILVFDLETGGLKPKYHPITEIAFVVVDAVNLEIVDNFSRFIKPYRSEELYTPDALALTGQSREFLEEEGKDYKEVIDEMIDFFYDQRVRKIKPILGGHNIINFDVPFLDEFLTMEKYKMSKYINILHYFDTLFWGRLMHTELPNYQLGTLCQRHDIPLSDDDAHGALEDATANAELVITMLRKLRGEVEEKKEVNFKF